MIIVIALLIVAGTVYAEPTGQQRIVGGWATSIGVYPEVASLLYSYSGAGHRQACGGTILNIRSILTAAHCVVNDIPPRWRVRLGSTYANSGGSSYSLAAIISHAAYNRANYDNDVAILRTYSSIIYGSLVKPGRIAGPNYHVGDNQALWAVGWGTTSQGGSPSEVLQHVLIWAVPQNTCRQRYASSGYTVTDNMICSGWLDVGGRDQCQGDSGAPLFHNRVVVGVCSWGIGCAQSYYPGVNARVSRFTTWIQANV